MVAADAATPLAVTPKVCAKTCAAKDFTYALTSADCEPACLCSSVLDGISAAHIVTGKPRASPLTQAASTAPARRRRTPSRSRPRPGCSRAASLLLGRSASRPPTASPPASRGGPRCSPSGRRRRGGSATARRPRTSSRATAPPRPGRGTPAPCRARGTAARRCRFRACARRP
jgi:hypothetical protein